MTFETDAVPLRDQLYRQAMSWTRNPDDAEDAVQETYFRAYRSWHTYQEGTNVAGWMTTILRNTIATLHRRQQPELLDPTTMLEHRPVWGSAPLGVETQVIEQLDLSPLGAVLDSLTPSHRRCLVAASMYGRDSTMQSDLAALFGTVPGTVGSRLCRARRHARAKLAELGVTP